MGLLSVPLKTVLPWHADLQGETPPDDWRVCDGTVLSAAQQDINPGSTYTLPDLRNRFLIGADITKAAGSAGVAATHSDVNAAAGAPGPKGTGGGNVHNLSASEMPNHTHVVNDPGHAHPNVALTVSPTGSSGWSSTGGSYGSANSGSASTGISIQSTGGGVSHENRPRYYGIVYIMKVKY